MKRERKVAIIGESADPRRGVIAKRLRERLEAEGVEVVFSIRRSDNGGPSYEELLDRHKPEAVFVAISTLDRGEAARDYILKAMAQYFKVVLCEKGALSSFGETLWGHLSQIGFSAAVGGGTLLLPYIKSRRPNSQRMEIHAVLNGTLHYVFDEMRRGRSLAEACGEASKLGYAEPGADGPLSLINGELVDVVRKACVFFNTTLARREFLTPDILGSLTQTAQGVERLSRAGGDCCFVVSFSNSPSAEKPAFVGEGFVVEVEGWVVSGGFREVGNLSEFNWLPGGVGNAVHIAEGELGAGGKYTLSGPGAGPEATTSAMLDDYHQLCP